MDEGFRAANQCMAVISGLLAVEVARIPVRAAGAIEEETHDDGCLSMLIGKAIQLQAENRPLEPEGLATMVEEEELEVLGRELGDTAKASGGRKRREVRRDDGMSRLEVELPEQIPEGQDQARLTVKCSVEYKRCEVSHDLQANRHHSSRSCRQISHSPGMVSSLRLHHQASLMIRSQFLIGNQSNLHNCKLPSCLPSGFWKFGTNEE